MLEGNMSSTLSINYCIVTPIIYENDLSFYVA